MDMKRKIEQLLKKKQYQEAITLCNELLDQQPSDQDILYVLAYAMFISEDYTNCIIVLKKIIEINQANIDALMLLAQIYSWGYGGSYSEAETIYRQVLIIDKKKVDAYIGLALSRRSPGTKMSINESIKILESALSIDNTRPELYFNLAYTYWELGDFQNAKENFLHSLNISEPKNQQNIRKILQEIDKKKKPNRITFFGPLISIDQLVS